MKKEQYIPSSEEVKKAEDMISEEEKEMSEERELTYNADHERDTKKENIIKIPETLDDVRNLVIDRSVAENKIAQINDKILEAPREIFENNYCYIPEPGKVYFSYHPSKRPIEEIINFFKKIGVEIDPESDLEKPDNSVKRMELNNTDVANILMKHGWIKAPIQDPKKGWVVSVLIKK